jgi:hypothetical protein
MARAVAGYNIAIAPCLKKWIDRNMPELGGMQAVRVRCCDRLPFQWLPGFMPTVCGITLWNTIYLKHAVCRIDPADLASVELLLHELVHVRQFRRGPILFPLTYLVHLVRFGYWNIPAEKEARGRADQLIQRYRQERHDLS